VHRAVLVEPVVPAVPVQSAFWSSTSNERQTDMSLNSQIFQNSGVWRCPLDVTT
jgi:hypothetical protein